MPPQSADRTVQVWVLLGIVLASAVLFGTVHAWAWAVISVATLGLVVHQTIRGSRVGSPVGTTAWGLSAVGLTLAGLGWLIPVDGEARAVVQPGLAPAMAKVTDALGVDALPLALAPDAAWQSVGRAGVVVALGWTAATVLRTRTRRMNVLVGMVASCAVVSLLGLVHSVCGLSSIYGVSDVPAGPLRSGFFAPFVNPNHGGLYCVLGLPLICGIGWRRDPAQNAAMAVAAMVCVAGAVVAGSRGAALACGVGLAVVVMGTAPVVVARLVGAVSATGMAAMTVWLARADLRSTGRSWLAGDGQHLDGGRVQIWTDALVSLGQAPWLGSGGGGFATVWRMVETGPRYGDAVHAHNDPLQALVEYGLVMGTAWCALAAVPLVLAVRRIRTLGRGRRRRLLSGVTGAYCALGAASLVSFPLHVGGLAVLGVVLAGLMIAAAGQEGRPVSRRVQRVARATQLLCAVAAAGITASAAWTSDDSAPAEQLDALDAQLHARPLWYRGWLKRADLRLAAGDPAGALGDLDVATLVWPSVPWAHVARARLQTRLGNQQAARDAWKAALSLNFPDNDDVDRWMLEAIEQSAEPTMELFLVTPDRADRLRDAGGTARRLGDPLTAMLFFERAFELDPTMGLPLVRQMQLDGLPREARKTLQTLPSVVRASCRGHVLAAELALDLVQSTEALASGRAAIRTCPEGHEPAWVVMVRARLATGDRTAVEPMGVLLEAQPLRHDWRRALIAAVLAVHDDEAAELHLQALEDAGVATDWERSALERIRRGLPIRAPQ